MTWAVLAAGEGRSFTDLNFRTTLITWIAFGVTYLVLRVVAWPRLAAMLEARELRIAAGVRRAEDAEALARELLARREQVLDEARREAHQLLGAARAAAEAEANERLRSAQQQLAEERQQARDQVRRERAEALEGLKEAVVDLTLLASSRLLERDLRGDEPRRLAGELIDDLAATQQAGNPGVRPLGG